MISFVLLILFCRFMPCLKYIVQNADNKDYKLLRGKTIECISLIGLAVGQQKVGFKQGSHGHWETWKMAKKKSMHGKIMEFEK